MVEKLAGIIKYPGGKRKVANKIIKEFPKEYKIFSEPFVGGGAVYWAENKANKRIINDKHKPLIDFYKKFRNTPCKVIEKCNANVSKKKFNQICEKKKKTVCDTITSHVKGFTGFCEKGYSHKEPKLINLKAKCENYKEKLQHTTILNQDWKKVAERYDTKDTVQYLDPPYFKKSFNYRVEGVKPEEVCSFARKAKSKVIISYDNRPEVRKACRGLRMKKIELSYGPTTKSLGKPKKVKELLIKNF